MNTNSPETPQIGKKTVSRGRSKTEISIVAGIFLGMAAMLAIAATPIKNLVLQGDMDADGNAIINLATSTNEASAATLGQVQTNIANASTNYATAEQGDLADSATQPGDIAPVATSGDYDDLTNKPTIGSAATNSTGDFASAAEGVLATTAIQPADNNSLLTNDAGYLTASDLETMDLVVKSLSTDPAVFISDQSSSTNTTTTLVLPTDGNVLNWAGTSDTEVNAVSGAAAGAVYYVVSAGTNSLTFSESATLFINSGTSSVIAPNQAAILLGRSGTSAIVVTP